jgi:hypothetical protein
VSKSEDERRAEEVLREIEKPEIETKMCPFGRLANSPFGL